MRDLTSCSPCRRACRRSRFSRALNSRSSSCSVIRPPPSRTMLPLFLLSLIGFLPQYLHGPAICEFSLNEVCDFVYDPPPFRNYRQQSTGSSLGGAIFMGSSRQIFGLHGSVLSADRDEPFLGL